jgi:hypothetical protein
MSDDTRHLRRSERIRRPVSDDDSRVVLPTDLVKYKPSFQRQIAWRRIGITGLQNPCCVSVNLITYPLRAWYSSMLRINSHPTSNFTNEHHVTEVLEAGALHLRAPGLPYLLVSSPFWTIELAGVNQDSNRVVSGFWRVAFMENARGMPDPLAPNVFFLVAIEDPEEIFDSSLTKNECVHRDPRRRHSQPRSRELLTGMTYRTFDLWVLLLSKAAVRCGLVHRGAQIRVEVQDI